jgi:hypothetical protein
MNVGKWPRSLPVYCHITNCGNRHLHAQLVESAWAYQYRAAVSVAMKKSPLVARCRSSLVAR